METEHENSKMEIEMNGTWMRGTLAVVAMGLLAACGGAQADGAEAEGAKPFARVINVEVVDVQPQQFEEEIRLTGTVWANQDVQIAAQESGVIRRILVDKGSRVTDGQPLIKIDDAILTAQVAQARAQADLASQTWDRRQRLWEEDQVGSELAYLEAKFGAEQTAANLAGLEERLDRTTVRAPFDGIMEMRMVEVGSMVSPGQIVARVVDLATVKVVSGVPERYAADVRRGSRGVVYFDVLPEQSFPGTIGYVGSTVDPTNRTFAIEIAMANPRRLIKPEMVANISVARRSLSEAIVVPQDALVRVEAGYVAFVAEQGPEGMVARVRPVELGPTQRNQVVVETGLGSGDRLIVIGQKSVADGDRINIVGN